MRKKLLAVSICMAMTAGMLAGCGSSAGKTAENEADKSTETAKSEGADKAAEKTSGKQKAEDYTIAIPFPESGLTSFEILRSNMDQLQELTGGTITNNLAELTADGTISFVESQIAAGVEGLIICPPADSVLPTVSTLCEEAGVYWGITYRSIQDDEIRELCESSEYYVGNCYENEYDAGYMVGKNMGEKGYKKIAITSQPKGDTTCDAREAGLAAACEEYGMKIVGEARGFSQASEATSAAESFLAANADLDAIFVIGSAATGAHEAIVKAIQDAGRSEVKLQTIDFPDGIVADFESGILEYSVGQVCFTYDPYITILKVLNAIQGTPVKGEGQTFSSNAISMFAIDSLDAANNYVKTFGDTSFEFYTDEELNSTFFNWMGADLTEASLGDLIEKYNPL